MSIENELKRIADSLEQTAGAKDYITAPPHPLAHLAETAGVKPEKSDKAAVSQQDVIAALMAVGKKYGRADIERILKQFGATNASQITKPADLKVALDLAEKALADD